MNYRRKLFALGLIFLGYTSVSAMDNQGSFYVGKNQNNFFQYNNKVLLYCPVSSCDRHDQTDPRNEFTSDHSLKMHLFRIHALCGQCYFEMVKTIQFEAYPQEYFLEKMKEIQFYTRRELITHCSLSDEHKIDYCHDCFHSKMCKDEDVFMCVTQEALRSHVCKHTDAFLAKSAIRAATPLNASLAQCLSVIPTVCFKNYNQGEKRSVRRRIKAYTAPARAVAPMQIIDLSEEDEEEDVIFVGEKISEDRLSNNLSWLGYRTTEQKTGWSTLLCTVMSSTQGHDNSGIHCFACSRLFYTEEAWQAHLLTCPDDLYYN